MTDPGSLVNRVMNDCIAAMASVPGMTAKEAQDTVEAMAQNAYEQACQRTNDIYTEGRGNEMLQRESRDTSLHAAFEKRRAEGATDDDIRWWWNMSVFEQEMIVQQDEMNRSALFQYLRKHKGMEPAEAARKVFKCHVKWGDPTDGTGDDRPLPYELKHRVVSYIEKLYGDSATLEKRIETESSFNALVRKEIRNGNL